MCEDIYNRFIRAILSLKDEDECKRLVSDLFTSKEVKDISSRLEVAHLLSEGVNYTEIARITGASTATISRVSKCLSGDEGGYRIVLPRIWGGGDVPSFSILVSSDSLAIRLYGSLLSRLTFLPALPAEGYSSRLGGVSVSVSSPIDLPALFSTGAFDLALTSTLPLEEEGIEYECFNQFEGYESLVLKGNQGTEGRVLTPYPSATAAALSSRGNSFSAVRYYGNSSSLKLAGDCLLVESVVSEAPIKGAIADFPYALVCRTGLADEVKALFR